MATRSSVWVVAVAVSIFIGCDKAAVVGNADGGLEQSIEGSLQADEIVSAVLQQYQAASNYHDKAVLYLSYRLSGRAIQEPHPWSVAWDRNGRYSADLFNAKIRCDGRELSCYVFDIETGNIDNQHRLVPASRFGTLLNDPIASHFIGGTSELPLFNSESSELSLLVPPMMGFVDDSLRSPWLKATNEAKRLADDDSTGTLCYVVEFTESKRFYRMWVDQKSGLIQQIQLPLEYLDSDILAADEVTDLKFFVRFHDAVLGGDNDEKRFEIKKRLATKVVSQFVELPEPLACEILGEKIGKWALVDRDGHAFEIGDDAESSVLIWMVGGDEEKLISQLESMGAGIPHSTVVVYSDDLMVNESGGAEMRLPLELQKRLDSCGVVGVYDPQMKTSSQIKLKSVPSFVVLDRKRRIQFAKPIDTDDWTREMEVAAKRVASGENLAAEMKDEYQKFLDGYHRQIAAKGVGPGAVRNNNLKNVDVGTKLESYAKLVWESAEFKDSGNVHIQPSTGRVFVIDGWQTIVELDSGGRVAKRVRLPIPTDSAVNRIRSVELNGEEYFVAYAMLGRKLFLFDDQWNLAETIPAFGEDDLERLSITGCQVLTGGRSLRIGSLQGMYRFGLGAVGFEKISEGAVKSFAALGQKSVYVRENQLEISNKPLSEFLGWRANAVAPLARDRFILTGTDSVGNWQLFSINEAGQLLWKESIGPQTLDNEAEPLVAGVGDGASMAVAIGVNEEVNLAGADGIVQRLRSDSSLRGVAFDCGKNWLYTSLGRRVLAWEIPAEGPEIIPASTPIKNGQ